LDPFLATNFPSLLHKITLSTAFLCAFLVWSTMRKAAREFLRSVRGRRSQKAFSRRLGYKGNPVADWEAGRRFPTASEAVRACLVAGLDVQAAFHRFHPRAADHLEKFDDAEIARWLNALRGSMAIGELSSRAAVSRYAISRWLSGQTRPRLPQLLVLLQAVTGRASDLLADIVPIDQLPSLRQEYRARQAAKHLAFELPWTEAVLRVLETQEHQARRQHDDTMIATTLNVDSAIVQTCIERLEHAGVISNKNNKYEVAGSLSVDTHGKPQRLQDLKAHWSSVALQRCRQPREQDLLSYNVFSCSHEQLEKIRQLLLTTYREIRGQLTAPQACETAALINLQLVEWNPQKPAQ